MHFNGKQTEFAFNPFRNKKVLFICSVASLYRAHSTVVCHDHKITSKFKNICVGEEYANQRYNIFAICSNDCEHQEFLYNNIVMLTTDLEIKKKKNEDTMNA